MAENMHEVERVSALLVASLCAYLFYFFFESADCERVAPFKSESIPAMGLSSDIITSGLTEGLTCEQGMLFASQVTLTTTNSSLQEDQ